MARKRFELSVAFPVVKTAMVLGFSSFCALRLFEKMKKDVMDYDIDIDIDMGISIYDNVIDKNTLSYLRNFIEISDYDSVMSISNEFLIIPYFFSFDNYLLDEYNRKEVQELFFKNLKKIIEYLNHSDLYHLIKT